LIAIFCGGLLSSSTARAQPDETARKAAAQAHFKQGRAFFTTGEYDKAIAEYRSGYELTNWPGFLFNIGLAFEGSGENRQALAHYKLYLELDPNGEASDEAAEYVARLTREIEEEEAVVRRKRESEEAEARRKREREQEAAEARERATMASRARSKRRLRLAGLLTVASGLVSLGVGIKFGLDARRASEEVSAHTEGAWPDSLIARYDEGERSERKMFIFTGVAAAALIGGGVLYLSGRSDVAAKKDSRLSLWPTVGRGRATLSLTGGF
jgi:tetratricopeptide (TPR) repeat protein